MQLIAESITKTFDEHIIFKDISFTALPGRCLAILGPNGSGKTTLMRILSKLLLPTRGMVTFKEDERILNDSEIRYRIGFLGPYLELYQDLSALENLSFFARIRGLKGYQPAMYLLLEQFGLKGREHDPVRAYSSGMKQRLKYVFALLHQPDVLFVDEPRSNLDAEGISRVYDLFTEYKKERLLILATNDREDLRFADEQIKIQVAG
jgi:heme exporter protein A